MWLPRTQACEGLPYSGSPYTPLVHQITINQSIIQHCCMINQSLHYLLNGEGQFMLIQQPG
jgi:hypothetical protein